MSRYTAALFLGMMCVLLELVGLLVAAQIETRSSAMALALMGNLRGASRCIESFRSVTKRFPARLSELEESCGGKLNDPYSDAGLSMEYRLVKTPTMEFCEIRTARYPFPVLVVTGSIGDSSCSYSHHAEFRVNWREDLKREVAEEVLRPGAPLGERLLLLHKRIHRKILYFLGVSDP